MSELESDIREAHHAISDAMKSDDRVDALLPRCSRLAYSSSSSTAVGGGDDIDASHAAYTPTSTGYATGVQSIGGGGEKSAGKKGTLNLQEEEVLEGEGGEDPHAPDAARRAAIVRLLQTHLWRIRAAGGQLSELSQQVEATREVWELFLDGVRNRTVRLNLQATIMTLALTVTAVPASLAGMNIPNGFEDSHPTVFWSFTGVLAAVSIGTWAHLMGVFRSGSGFSGSRVDDLRALRFVLQRMDELDDVMRATKGSASARARGQLASGGDEHDGGGKNHHGLRTKEELVRALKEVEVGPDAAGGGHPGGGMSHSTAGGGALGSAATGATEGIGGRRRLGLVAQLNELEPSALDLIFKVFDRDGDGRINPSEEWIIRPYPADKEDST